MSGTTSGNHPSVDAYLASPSNAAAEAVIEAHRDLGRYAACRALRWAGLTWDDLDHRGYSTVILMAIWDAVRGYDPGRAKFTTWATNMVKYRVSDEMRARGLRKRPGTQRRIRAEVEISLDALQPGLHQDNFSAPCAVDGMTQRDNLKAALCALPREARIMFIMRHVHGMTQKEVGEAIGTTEAVVNQTLYVGRKLLRERAGRLREILT